MSSVTFQISTIALDIGGFNNFSVVPAALSLATQITPSAQLVQTTFEQPQYFGLLYTPIVANRCTDTQSVIPRNLTLDRLSTQRFLIAFAPSSNCRDFYVNQATLDGAKAIVLYPPTVDSTPVGLNTYTAAIPVYYASWFDASPIAVAMNSYNTDLTDVPFGSSLATMFPAGDQIRLLLAVARTGASTRSLPGLWIFLLIVLGILCLVVAATSLAMHTHQYLARRDLRRRIAAGEVDLEALGIKHLTVPTEYVNALPRHIWLEDTGPVKSLETSKVESTTPQQAVQLTSTYNQTNCSICLDEYVAHTSSIRELPCQHIYHVDCIDPFLLKRSSLCPLCKQSVLPPGFIPPDSVLTSATVMRERRRRRLEARNRASGISNSREIELQPTNTVVARHTVSVLSSGVATDDVDHEPRLGITRRLWTALFPGRA